MLDLKMHQSFDVASDKMEQPRAFYVPFAVVEGKVGGERRLLLNGTWDFCFFDSLEEASLDADCNFKMPVPSNWQMSDFGNVQYTNYNYPFPFYPPYVPKENPCGLYKRTFEISKVEGEKYFMNFEGVDSCFYVWLNGIDNAPTLSMVEDSGRRLGDKYIVVGSWNNGEVYCKDYNTGNIVRYAMFDGRFGEWPGADGLAYARGRCDYNASVADAAGCIGSAYIYPGAAGAVAGTVPGFLVSSTASAHYVANVSGNVYASSADLGLPLTHGYSFFKDDKTNLNYIAYVALTANQDQGSVKVISDFNGTADGFMSVLQKNEVIFEAPVQDAMDATVLSPCPATHSTGDCVVREINGETYMAVMIQNVGISVFKMNAGFIAE